MVKKRLNLYVLNYPNCLDHYDVYTGYVVAAKSTSDARKVANAHCTSGIWLDSSLTDIRKIGVATAKESEEAGVILDF
jgi:hypothetical protein